MKEKHASILSKTTRTPQGSVACFYEEGAATYYIQLSPAEEHPNWIRLGLLLEHMLADAFSDTDFIKNLFYLMEEAKRKTPNQTFRIIQITREIKSDEPCSSYIECNCTLCCLPN